MEKYIGTKVIKAQKMTLGEFEKMEHKVPGLAVELPPNTPGYWVGYPGKDGKSFNGALKEGCQYVSWSPANIFEGSYKSVEVEDIKEKNGNNLRVLLDRNFTFLPLKRDEEKRYYELNIITREYAAALFDLVPRGSAGPEKDEMFKKLSEVQMWAQAAITRYARDLEKVR